MGLVASAWSMALASETGPGRRYTLHATVPPNARARIIMPVPPTASIREGGVSIWADGQFLVDSVVGVLAASAEADGGMVGFEVGSGNYIFTAEL